MMYRRIVPVVLILLLGLTAFVQAQTIQPLPDDEIDPNANISWPPPVYTLRGEVDIRGTADLPDQMNYFLEFRPLMLVSEDEPAVTSDPPWFPATLPTSGTVSDDVLGAWNTEAIPDGLYELRLTINVRNQPATYFIVTPLRIENDIPDFLDIDTDTPTVEPARPTPVGRPTLAASPTPLDTTPTVTANVDANVRSGDNTNYSRIGLLRTGQSAAIIGVSTTGSGWYYIQLPDGQRGWIAPSVVTASGAVGGLPRIAPPATPTPAATNTPVAVADLTGSPPSLTPSSPTCKEPFQVLVNVTNTGSGSTNSEATVLFENVHIGSGSVEQSFTRTIPVLNPGDNYVVGGEFNISTFFNEAHRVRVTIDVFNQVPETNEANNVLSTDYTLQQGTCP